MAGGPRQVFQTKDDAVSDVLGEILTIGIFVALFAVAAVAFVPSDPPTDLKAEVTASVRCGADGWGSGDETVVIEHAGGQPIEQHRTRIHLLLNGTPTEYGPSTLGGPFADGAFTTGEQWRTQHTIGMNSTLALRIFYAHTDGAEALWHDAAVKTRTCATA